MKCPQSPSDNLVCGGKGECDETLGLCSCNAGNTLDDCTAAGIIELTDKIPAATLPPIGVDGWAFFSFFVGCPDVGFTVDFSTEDKKTLPGLFVSRSKLPLMLEGTSDFSDYYDHGRHHPRQRIQVEGCVEDGCVVHPGQIGTIFR